MKLDVKKTSFMLVLVRRNLLPLLLKLRSRILWLGLRAKAYS